MTDDAVAPTERTEPTTNASPAPAPDSTSGDPIDLVAIERDLAAVEAALPRLDDGSYWRDDVTGDEIPDEVLAADPVARRA